MACAAAVSTADTLPPSTGLWASAAYKRPGSFTSMPNSALPSTLPAESSLACGVPMIRKLSLGLSCTSFGTGNRAAAAATDPKVDVLPSGPMMSPFCARQALGSTRQRSAAAAISMVRACAPAVRNLSQDSWMLLLVPVTWPPLPGLT